jgi:hypothetical protein
MLHADELKRLSAWCGVRAMTWRPLLRAGEAAVLLEPRGQAGCWQRMTLARLDHAFELSAEDGELLAVSSDLRAVLDAVDGGVAEPAMAYVLPQERMAAGALVL